MIVSSSNDTDQVGLFAVCLADNFLKPLYDFCNERNYFVYVGCLAEILDFYVPSPMLPAVFTSDLAA